MPDFGRMFLKLKYTDLTKKNLYPKLNGYGDNGERSLKYDSCYTFIDYLNILKLAAICGFCNVNICT